LKGSSKKISKGIRETLSGWKVIYEGFDPPHEKLRESLCTLGNGYMGVRSALPGSKSSKTHYPATYVAGGYNTLPTAVSGKKIFNEDLVNCPNSLFLSFRIEQGEWIDLEKIKILSYRQDLDMKSGVLTRDLRVRDKAGNISRIREERLVHMEFQHIIATQYRITPENYSKNITVRSSIDGAVENEGVARYSDLNSRHLAFVSSGSVKKNVIHLTVKTVTSKIEISLASKLKVRVAGESKNKTIRVIKDRSEISQETSFIAEKGKPIVIEKTCSIFTSRDRVRGALWKKATQSVSTVSSFERLLNSHISAWRDLWKTCDIEIKGDVFSQTLLRFNIFHLLQSASKHNRHIDAGLGPRGLHGESYRGHIFWDEIFFMPFFSGHLPETAEALLMYRYRRLSAARKYAKENGYAGAMFPWQSGSSGEEETQSIHLNPMSGKWGPDLSRNQRHVSFAVAYNVWRHWVITGDLKFVRDYGGEIILSVAKFAASLCFYDKNTGRYHTKGLMGPAEFHEKLPGSKQAGLKDNAYSNFFIVWTLLRAMDVLEILSPEKCRELKKKANITEADLRSWEDISRKMNIIISPDGIISQFRGYFSLKELDWKAYRKKYGNIHRLDRILKAEGRSPDAYKVAKQADVLMLFFLFPFNEVDKLFSRLGYKCDKNMLKKNYRYYEQRTSHGSTLSKVVHCYVAHLLGMRKLSFDWFENVLEADIHDFKGGTTLEGIHTGIMGGSIDIVTRAFAGLHVNGNGTTLSPGLPPEWEQIKFRFKTKNIWFSVVSSKNQGRVKPLPEKK
jgi:trehalose/maltose hydrolase-like predicted phosphorylase